MSKNFEQILKEAADNHIAEEIRKKEKEDLLSNITKAYRYFYEIGKERDDRENISNFLIENCVVYSILEEFIKQAGAGEKEFTYKQRFEKCGSFPKEIIEAVVTEELRKEMPSYSIEVDWKKDYLYKTETFFEKGLPYNRQIVTGSEYILSIKASIKKNGKTNTNILATESKLEVPYVDIKSFDNDIREHLAKEIITFIENLCKSKTTREILEELGILIEYTTCTINDICSQEKEQLKLLVLKLFSKIDSEVIGKIQGYINDGTICFKLFSYINAGVSYFIDDNEYYLKIEYKNTNVMKTVICI